MNHLLHRRCRRAWLTVLLLVTAFRLSAQTDGIFADFNTSMGSFTCRLDYAVAPKAVANFVGLATGQQAWLDLNTGEARTTPFHNGLTFHRVIAGFMIQGGSPNGQGTDGPGYAFVDEFSPTARHDGPGVLSMANSGTDSNGAQFFITAAATPWLNDLHTVFGRVVGGMEVVTAINQVATGPGDKPKTNVVVEAVTIRRVGAAAEAFDIRAQGLPVVGNQPLQLAVNGTDANLTFTNREFAHNRVFASTNLTVWTASSIGLETGGTVSNSVIQSAAATNQFFKLAQVQYPSSTLSPKSLLNRVLTLNFGGNQGSIVITFNGTGGGTYVFGNGNGTVIRYVWTQEPYVGRIWPIQYSELVDMTLRLNFDSATAGTFSGTAYATNPFSVSGSFTLAP
jgi:peptidyl-prolyl cis-trans isomerase A (cyclophilin A)